MYDSNNIIKKYNNVNEIIDEYYVIRLKLYKTRKEYELNKLKGELLLENTKIRFINDVINENIIIYRKKKEVITKELEKHKYPYYVKNKLIEYKKNDSNKDKYNYLIKIPLYNFTEEKIIELQDKIDKLTNQYNNLDKKTIHELWLDELNIFEKEYKKLK